jgi:hypothetical protein
MPPYKIEGYPFLFDTFNNNLTFLVFIAIATKARVPCLHILATGETVSLHPHLLWSYGAILRSCTGACRVLSNAVSFV